jgi:deoxycytidine triphosphate deaminase
MPSILSDMEINKLIGSVIVNGDRDCVHPNSYIIRLGDEGEFLNTGKEFELGKSKKGIRIQPGHSVGVTALETVDFRRSTVHKLYPDNDLFGIVSPTTDLSREGLVAPTTQVDAGYFGTLNWTITNTSSEERRFVHKERIFRLTIFRLEKGETPQSVYEGDYQSQLGYVRSRRKGPPVGMKDAEWEDPHVKGGPENLLDDLMKAGYPWHALGQRLKVIDQQFETVTNEYGEIRDSIDKLSNDVVQIKSRQSEFSEAVRKVVREEAGDLQNRWLIGASSLLLGLVGVALAVYSNKTAAALLEEHGMLVGFILAVGAAVSLIVISKGKNK